MLLQRPGSDLEEDEEEEDVPRVEQGEDLWQTRRDEEAVARAPSVAAGAALGEAEAGEVGRIFAPFPGLHAHV